MTLAKRESSVTRVATGAAALVVFVAGAYVFFGQGRTRRTFREPAGRTVRLTYNFTVGDIAPDANRVLAWVPIPPTDSVQRLMALRVEGDIPHRTVNENEYGNRFLLIDLSNKVRLPGGNIDVSIWFLVTRYATDRLNDTTRLDPLDKLALQRHLQPDSLVPITGRIAAEARAVVAGVSEPARQARLLYDHIINTMIYDKSGKGWGRGDAVYACNVRRGNCSDFHSLFIGQARALGIPSRFIMGLPLPANARRGRIGGYHCWAEFYVSGRGWIPIDASEANRFPDKREIFFGSLDEHRVAFSVGRDIGLPEAKAGPVNFAIYPHVEVQGRVHENVATSFFFEDCPHTAAVVSSAWPVSR